MDSSGPSAAPHPTARLVGTAAAMEALRAQIRHLATFDTVGSALVPTLLLQGETGTGKGLVARVIHDSGPRARGPFVDVNCAALPETMLEAELFGFEPGSFTDAKRAKPGLFEAASGGTLFLDEVDALPLALQGKLLTAIEAKQVRRLGAVVAHTVDVKLIAATNAALPAYIAAGRFRIDLYHRLAVVVVALPPLRQREQDVLVLAQDFLAQYTAAHGVPSKRLTPAAETWLREHTWPGNVRELSHLMERVTLLHVGQEVDATTLLQFCLPLTSSAPDPATVPGIQVSVTTDGLPAEAERIRQALVQTAGNVARAARLLGLSRDTIRYRMQRYKLDRALPEALPQPGMSPPPPGATARPVVEAAPPPPSPGSGSVVGQRQVEPDAIARRDTTRLEAAPTAGEARRRPSKILIVDDEPLNVDYLEQELEDLGYATVSASNGREALDKVATEAPDLILLDIMMPLMDGFTVCRLLKGDDETRLIPIVIMTALGSMEDRIKGIEAGADDFLTKPVHPQALLARIQTTLRLKHTVDRKIQALRRAKDHFAKFVPEAVRRLVAANPEAPELAKMARDVSVLFVDISGYTRLSEQLSPEGLNRLVERYFSAFLDRIHEAGGDINETSGDGFMALFQETDGRAHPVNAVETALSLLVTTEALNRASGAPPFAIHMGLNSGHALVGSTRFEGIRGTRWTFTASGAVTNVAARLAALAAAGQLLVGPETARRLEQSHRLERLDHTTLHTLEAGLDIYRVLGPARAG